MVCSKYIPFTTVGRSVVPFASRSGSHIALQARLTRKSPGSYSAPSKTYDERSVILLKRALLERALMNTLTNTTVLLVDDNIDSCDLLRFAFEESGASVVAAHSVNAALEAFRRCPAHAVIAD